MLPPQLMRTIYYRFNSIFFVAAVTLFAACTPPGPRALLEGKRLVEQGKYSEAVEKLKAANQLLGKTNAQAFNFLGIAYHHLGQPADAEKAYRQALVLDHDLTEAHYNLGCLWLEQNRLDAAKTEFTACTLRRQNSLEGFLKLGAVQLRLAESGTLPARARELTAAENNFKEALRLAPQNPEALNGLGLVQWQRGRATEAAQYFNTALQQQPAYGPALLNLAVVSQQYLNDRQTALKRYREYLALKPAPANSAAVSATLRQLELETGAAARPAAAPALPQNPASPSKAPPSHGTPATATPKAGSAAPVAPSPRSAISPTSQPAEPRQDRSRATAPNSSPKSASVKLPEPAGAPTPAPAGNLEVVSLSAEPVFQPAQDVTATGAHNVPPEVSTAAPTSPTGSSEAGSTKRGSLLQRMNPLRLFGSEEKTAVHSTPLPTTAESSAEPGKSVVADTAAARKNPTQGGPRYPYRFSTKPAPGNRSQAQRPFAQGLASQKARRMLEAMKAYQQATQLDPSFFEAQHNLGLAASEAGETTVALGAYERALALQPDSVETRYNFALALRQGNYLADAANELEKILAMAPGEARAHLALGNLYAQQLHQPAKARQHYLKVLETDPHNAQAGPIRYWLAENR